MMKIELSGSVWLQCLFLSESQTKRKGEGRIGMMYCSLLLSAKEKGSAWSRSKKNSPKDEENSLPVGDPKPN